MFYFSLTSLKGLNLEVQGFLVCWWKSQEFGTFRL